MRASVITVGAALLPLVPFSSATAATAPIAFASLQWGINDTSQGAAHAGGCDYFVAGHSDGTAASYKTTEGGVYIVKESSTGVLSAVTAANRCEAANGSSIGQRIYFSGGSGQRDTATGAVTINWEGAATVNAYGGLAPWYVEDPVLTLDGAGNGTVKADVGGYASSMANPNVKEPLPPRTDVVVATVTGADVSSGTGVTITPVYQGVDYFPLDTNGVRTATSAIPASAKANDPKWGAWPTEFVDFQYATGLSTYWHTSGGSADPKKPPLPITVKYSSSVPAFAGVAPSITDQPGNLQAVIGEDVAFEVGAEGSDLRFQWQRSDSGSWVDLAGETTDTLAFDNAQPELSGSLYRVNVSNDLGSVTTQVSELRVEAAVAPEAFASPETLVLPENGTDFFGGAASGYPDPSYQWQVSTDGGTTWADSGTASTTQGHKITSATLAQDGNLYRFRASNGQGSPAVSAAADLKVVPHAGTAGIVVLPGTQLDPAVANSLEVVGGGFPTNAPGHIIVAVVETALFDPAAPPAPNHASVKKAAFIGQAPYNQRALGTFRASPPTLGLSASALDPAKAYSVVTYTFPTASAAFATSTPLTFGATTPLSVSGQPANAAANTGGTASFSATVAGAPAPTAVRWQFDDGDGWTYLADQTGSTLNLTNVTLAQAGSYRLVAFRGADKVVSDAATLTVTQPLIAGAPTPKVSGTAVAGKTVKAVPGTWPAGTTLKYQWYADSTPIGKTAAIVVPRSAIGKKLKVAITGTKAGNLATTKTSAATLRTASVGKVRITGTAKVGRTLRAVPTGWTPGAKIVYKWRIGTKVITTTKATLKLTAPHKGKKIRVSVVVTKASHTTVTGQSALTKAVAKK